MAQDRGGLSYNIAVRDEFSKNIESFRQGIRSAKAEFDEFSKTRSTGSRARKKELTEEQKLLQQIALEAKRQRDVERQAIALRRSIARDESQENKRLLTSKRELEAIERRRLNQERAAARERAKILRDEQRQLKALADAEKARERTSQRISQQMNKDRAAAARRDPEIQAQQRLNRALFEESVQRAQISKLRARSQQLFAQGDLLGGQRSLQQAKDLERSLKGIESTGNRLLFTFRRLVGVLAVFTLARQAVAGFQELVTSGVALNNTVAETTIGVGGLLSTLTEVRDEFGNTVTGAEALDRSIGVARQQVRALRQDSLRTAVGFQALIETFQTALAPGLSAGLDVDQIRKLTVNIAQAASAIALPQNQLAEEIRSLLSGTIQARTTRIATALGITNADIERLKEAGELFEFLQERFEGFAESSERQARSTLSGITGLVKGALTNVLGEAAEPLFAQLLETLNGVFDRVLTIRDASDQIRPNPQAVAAFRSLFEALEHAVTSAQNLAGEIGFKGLKATIDGIATAIEVLIGFIAGALAPFVLLGKLLGQISRFIGLSAKDLGKLAGVIGVVLGLMVAWSQLFKPIIAQIAVINAGLTTALNKMLGLTGATNGWSRAMSTVGPALTKIVAAFLIIPAVVQILTRFFTGLPVTFKDAFEIIGLVGQDIFKRLLAGIELGFKTLANSLVSIFTAPITTIAARFADLISLLRQQIAPITALIPGGDELQTRLAEAERQMRQFVANRGDDALFPIFTKESLDKDKRDLEASLAEIDKRYNELVQGIQDRSGEGAVSIEEINAQLLKFQASLNEGFFSTAQRPIFELVASLKEVQDELNKTQVAFAEAGRAAGLEGVGGQIAGLFGAQAIADAERLRDIRRELNQTEQRIARNIEEQKIGLDRVAEIQAALAEPLQDREAALDAIGIKETEGGLVSLLTDELALRNAIVAAQELSTQLTVTKAAIIAKEATPGLLRENQVLQAAAEAEQRLADIAVRRLGARRQATVEAQNALTIARLEASLQQQALRDQIAAIEQAKQTATGEELASLNALLAGLRQQLALEQDLTEAQQDQLAEALRLAQLVESGTLTQGFKEGFTQLAQDLPTAFEAGIAIVQQSVQALTQFISSSIVSAFDPTDDTDLVERFARFLQQIANLILQQLVQLAIAAALQRIFEQQSASSIEAASATAAAGIRLQGAQLAGQTELFYAQAAAAARTASSAGGGGFHQGGLVQGFNRGGEVPRKGLASPAHYTKRAQGFAAGGRPAGLHPLDTVPAWLQPGEFVMRKRAVDRIGLKTLMAMNGGLFEVNGMRASRAHGAAVGMAHGGVVTPTRTGGAREGSAVPVLVARERDFDTLVNGGRSNMLRFIRENSGDIRGILDRGR